MAEARNTRHLVDPEVAPVIDAMPSFEFDSATLELVRAGAAGRFSDLPEPPIAPEVRTIAGPAGLLDIYWFDPAPGTANRPALLHIHGGGMVLGSAKDMAHGPSGMAAALGIPVASVDYRLAPEAPFPGPQEDCLAGLAWLADSAAELGVDPARIAVIGESAGGGLAAAVAQMARDSGGPAVAAQVLIYPMLDHRTGGPGCRHNNRTTGEFIWTRASNQFGWECLRGDYAADDERKGWFSPSLADDLAGLPPTLLLTGSLDLFFDEDLDYARRLVDAGVPVELHSYPGAIHAFNMAAEAGVAKAFNRDMLGGIGRLLGV
jgi:acetyl esterase